MYITIMLLCIQPRHAK